MSSLLLPVKGYDWIDSWWSHWNNRSPKSTEPGTDLGLPIGTPLYAPADGTIWGYGESIEPAAGRWVGIDFDMGFGYRTIHHEENLIRSGRVFQGDLYAYSGASGYGSNDWSNDGTTNGAHAHATLWPSHRHIFGYKADDTPYTIDLMQNIAGFAGGGSSEFNPAVPNQEGEEDMAQPFVKVIREDMPVFWVVGKGQTVNPVPTDEAALRGVDKILGSKGFLSTAAEVPTVALSGEEIEAGALRAFGIDTTGA